VIVPNVVPLRLQLGPPNFGVFVALLASMRSVSLMSTVILVVFPCETLSLAGSSDAGNIAGQVSERVGRGNEIGIAVDVCAAASAGRKAILCLPMSDAIGAKNLNWALETALGEAVVCLRDRYRKTCLERYRHRLATNRRTFCGPTAAVQPVPALPKRKFVNGRYDDSVRRVDDGYAYSPFATSQLLRAVPEPVTKKLLSPKMLSRFLLHVQLLRMLSPMKPPTCSPPWHVRFHERASHAGGS
jgi:hypothetical protein